MLYPNEPTVNLPGLLLDSKNTDGGAGKTSSYTGRDKNAESCFIFSSGAGSRLVFVAFWN